MLAPFDLCESSRIQAIALGAGAHGICLRHGCVSRRERRVEGRDDQMARTHVVAKKSVNVTCTSPGSVAENFSR